MKHLAIALTLFLVPTTAQAVPKCADRDTMIAELGAKYAEQPTAIGLDNQGNLVEVLVSESGSWTILVTKPGKSTCLVSAGQAWQRLKMGTAL